MKRITLLVFLITSISHNLPASPIRYKVTDLGATGAVIAINNHGEAVGLTGDSTLENPITAFHWDGVAERHLDAFGATAFGWTSEARSINDAGSVVGTAIVPNGEHHAFVYRDDEMIDLGTLPGGRNSYAYDINNQGDIVGISEAYDGTSYADHLVIWRGTGTPQISALGSVIIQPTAINDQGHIAGWRYTGEVVRDLGVSVFVTRAMLYVDGVMNDLGTWQGYGTTADDINSAGQIAANFNTWDGRAHALIYEDGAFSLLDSVETIQSVAMSIGESGDVVGFFNDDDYQMRAALYRNGMRYDLNDLIDVQPGLILSWAWDVNDAGQIAVNGYLNDEGHRFLLTPVPEPSTFLIASMAALGIFCHRHARGRNKAS